MKYKLINKLIINNFAENLLHERGIENYTTFIYPTIECVQDPLALCNMEQGATLLLHHLKSDKEIIVIVDCDADGYTSAAILWNYIKETFPQANISYEIHSGKQHGLEDIMEKIDDRSARPSLIIIPDAGSNDFIHHGILHEDGIDVLVLDHHEFDSVDEHVVIINNQNSPSYINKALTGAGIVWQFCRYLDAILGYTFADKYIDLAALGIISDMANVLTLENRYIIKTGLQNINNYFFSVLVNKQSFSLGNKVTPMGIAFYITPLINAIIRVGTEQEKELLFKAFINSHEMISSGKRGEQGKLEEISIEMTRIGTNVRNRQNKIKEETVERLTDKIIKYDLLSNKILVICLEDDDELAPALTGIIAMQLAAKYKRPTLVGRLNNQGFIKGSMRGLNDSELKDFKQFINDSKLFEFCDGHANAAGFSIKQSNLSAFHNYANDILKDIDFNEDCYEVNFICNANDRINDLVIYLDEINDTYGQNNNEPLIVVKDIVITNNLIVMGKDHNTVKIIYQNMTYIFFKAEKFLAVLKDLNKAVITIVGKANLNYYNGSTTPQIIVEDWELVTKNIFDF